MTIFIKKDDIFDINAKIKHVCHTERSVSIQYATRLLRRFTPHNDKKGSFMDIKKQIKNIYLLGLGSGSPNITIKKAAMFGLDARIALAIFGALSVISGAALYSAIQTAKAESVRQTLNEMVKASEEYYLNNGQQLPQESANIVYGGDLINNRENLSTWQGPYIEGGRISDRSSINSITEQMGPSSGFDIRIFKASEWPTNNAVTCDIDDADCSQWIMVYSGNSATAKINVENLFNILDELVDNSDGALVGNIRGLDNGASDHRLLYKGIPHKRRI